MFNKVNTIASISYNLSSKSVQLSPNNSTTCSQILRAAPSSVNNILNTFVSVYVLVLPGSYTNPVPAVNLSLSTVGILSKKTGYINLPNASTFTAGNMYIYQVSIGLNLLGNTRAEIYDGGHQALLPAEIIKWTP